MPNSGVKFHAAQHTSLIFSTSKLKLVNNDTDNLTVEIQYVMLSIVHRKSRNYQGTSWWSIQLHELQLVSVVQNQRFNSGVI
jgi:hypothetical protein